MQQCFNVLTGVYNVFLFPFDGCILLKIKPTAIAVATATATTTAILQKCLSHDFPTDISCLCIQPTKFRL